MEWKTIEKYIDYFQFDISWYFCLISFFFVHNCFLWLVFFPNAIQPLSLFSNDHSAELSMKLNNDTIYGLIFCSLVCFCMLFIIVEEFCRLWSKLFAEHLANDYHSVSSLCFDDNNTDQTKTTTKKKSLSSINSCETIGTDGFSLSAISC